MRDDIYLLAFMLFSQLWLIAGFFLKGVLMGCAVLLGVTWLVSALVGMALQ